MQLIEATKNLFKQANVGNKMAEDLKMEVVREALLHKLVGEEPCSSRVDAYDESNAHLTRYSRGSERRVYTGPKQGVDAARETCEKVLSQVLHKERMRPVEDSYQSLMKSIRQVEDSVNYLLLRGKPEGHCPLCLNRSI